MSQTGPSEAREIRVLQAGFWERTSVIELSSGEQRVRKESLTGAAEAPWAIASLRSEIEYLESLPTDLAEDFPRVVHRWDDFEDGGSVGYEMPHFADMTDLASGISEGAATDDEARTRERALAEVVCTRLHQPVETSALAQHVVKTVERSVGLLCADPVARDVVSLLALRIDDRTIPGLPILVDGLTRSSLPHALDASPVRLHGDLILQNVLCGAQGRIVLIDPVSVAGISVGNPVFDLAKYESFAGGDLLAIRSEWTTAENPSRGVFRLNTDERPEALRRFRRAGLGPGFREVFIARHGAPEPRLCALLDGYFSLVMAVNTRGRQRMVRLLHGALGIAAALDVGRS